MTDKDKKEIEHIKNALCGIEATVKKIYASVIQSKELLRMASSLFSSVNDPLPHNINVLVVDDDVNDVALLKHILKSKGTVNYTIEYISDYDEALKEIVKNKHDVYLIDYGINEFRTGLQLIDESVDKGAVGPFIVWSGIIDEIEMEKIISSKVVGFISKDVNSMGFKNPRQGYIIINTLIRYAVKNFRINRSILEFQDELVKERELLNKEN